MAGIVTGDADDAIRADLLSRRLIAAILLADMDPVAAGLEGEIRPVIQQKGDTAPLRQRTQRIDSTAQRIIVKIFQP